MKACEIFEDTKALIETAFDWNSQTPEQLRAYARGNSANSTESKNAETTYNWSFVPDFPLSDLFNVMPDGKLGWIEWFKDEIKMDAKEKLYRNWKQLTKEEIHGQTMVGRHFL